MPEEVVEAPVTPAVATPAESVQTAQNPTESATEASADKAPEAVEAEAEPTPEQAAKRESRRFERRMANVLRREAEARARADILEKQLNETRQTQRQVVDGAPKLEDFTDIEDFRKAVESHAFERGLKESDTKRQQAAAKQQQEALVSSWEKKIDKGSDKYDDFAEKVGELQPNTPWAYAIMEADNGDDIAYYLGTHLDEARQIAALPAASQIRAIGRLEAKLSAEPPKQQMPSKAPAPIKPVGGKSGGTNEMPKDTDDIATWMKKENARAMRARTG